jgi:hypothetical protein
MSTLVTIGSDDCRHDGATAFDRLAPAEVHSGQWNPTEACTMHDGQIGRPQRWQVTPARRSVWR